MMNIEESIKTKRNEFLLDIINQFKQSDENQTISDCYNYVRRIKEITIESFLNTLSNEERTLVEINIRTWFQSIESIRIFTMYLSNKEITINQI